MKATEECGHCGEPLRLKDEIEFRPHVGFEGRLVWSGLNRVLEPREFKGTALLCLECAQEIAGIFGFKVRQWAE